MPALEAGWGRAFIRQAQSDLDTYERLTALPLPSCHRLHYLQMWLEKLCKAYLWSAAVSRSDLPEFKTSHKVVEKVLPRLIREYWKNIGYAAEPDFQRVRALCREIELLHPQIDADGGRPDNAEYPWAAIRDGKPVVVAPAEESFKVAERISNHVGHQLMKAAAVLTRNPTLWLTAADV